MYQVCLHTMLDSTTCYRLILVGCVIHSQKLDIGTLDRSSSVCCRCRLNQHQNVYYVCTLFQCGLWAQPTSECPLCVSFVIPGGWRNDSVTSCISDQFLLHRQSTRNHDTSTLTSQMVTWCDTIRVNFIYTCSFNVIENHSFLLYTHTCSVAQRYAMSQLQFWLWKTFLGWDVAVM